MKRARTVAARSLAAILCSVLVGVGAYAPLLSNSTPKAHALDIVYDPSNHIANTATSVATTFQTVAIKTLDGIAWQVAKVAIQSMTKSMIKWINSGYKGSPAFVTNLDNDLLKQSDTIALSVLQSLGTNSAWKSPFQSINAQVAKVSYLASTGKGAIFASNPYTLGKVSPTDNGAAFLRGDFSKGGLNAFFSAWTTSANNPFGALGLAQGEVNRAAIQAQNNRLFDIGNGKGFISWRGPCITTASQLNQAIQSGGITYADASTTGDVLTASGDGLTSDPSWASLQNTDACLAYDVQTPGSVVESQLELNLGTGIRQLELADSINEIVGAAVSQLVNQVLGGTGLLGSTRPSAGGGRSAVAAATDPAQYAANNTAISQGFAEGLTNEQTQITQYQTNWKTIQTAAQTAQTACANSPDALTQIQPVLTQAATSLNAAATTIAGLTTLQNEAKVVQTTSPSSQTAVLQAVSSDYSTFLSAPGVPTATDVTNALQQSSDSGTSTPSSLYTQMTNLTKSCTLGVVVGH